jgi:DNA-binding response OmpR family regulator
MGAKTRILVVDDHHRTVKIISSVLKKYGFEVFTASEGLTALKLATEVKPHLIILDVMIPGMDGYRVARRLKRDPETSGIAVLILTDKAGTNEDSRKSHELAMRIKDRLRGFDVGAVEFLTKPIKVKELIRRVKFVLWTGGCGPTSLLWRNDGQSRSDPDH